MRTEAQKRARLKYQRDRVRTIRVQFYPVDQELYDYAKERGKDLGVSQYIRELIAADRDRR